MADTAIAYGDSGSGKTSICVSLAKLWYELYGLTTRLISVEGWSVVENEGLIKNKIVSAYNPMIRPHRLLSDVRKLSRGYWPKISVKQVPLMNEDGIQVGFEEKKVRELVEDKTELAKVGLYFIETTDGIGFNYM